MPENKSREETERTIKALERELRVLQIKYETLEKIISSLNTGLSLINPDNTIAWVNAKIKEMFPKKDPAGQVCYQFYESADEPCNPCPTIQCFQSGKVCEIEKYNPANGRWYHIISQPIMDASGHVINVLEGVTDITQRKQVEDVLRQSEGKYRFLTEKMGDIIWTLDMNFKTTYVSPSIEEILGFTIEERKQQTLAEMITPQSMQKVQDVFMDELRRDESGTADPNRSIIVEIEYFRKDGSTVWMENNVKAIRNAAGTVVEIIGVSRDITDRKHAEMALKQSEQRYRTVLETSLDPIVVYDMEGRVTYFNPAFTRIFGWSLDERLGKKMDLFVPEETWPETQTMIRKVLAGESFSGFETRRYTKDGKVVCVNMSATVYKDEKGTPIGSVINLKDITEQKRLEAQLRQAQKMESIGTLAGGIAHDFNNILGIIVGYAELAMDDIPEWHPARVNLKEILTAGVRARDVVRQLLSFARKTELEKKKVNIASVVKEALKWLRSSIPTSIELRKNFEENAGVVLADPIQLNQILINLSSNAVHAMPDGGILDIGLKRVELDKQSAVHFHDFKPGPYVKLTFSDTGHGISQNDIGRIFDPYFTTKEVGKGTGMGLSVVHGIVKGHDGAILVHSEPDKGTTFSIFLPIIEDGAAADAEFFEAYYTGNEKILFLDDEPPIVKMAQQMLERLGYKVDVQTSAVEALALFRLNPDQYDLIITDMTMPLMNGDKLSQEILSIRPGMPIILCTGFSEKMTEEKAKELGIKAFALKPLVQRDLAALVRRVLNG